ncbi:MAG: pyridoxal phosphate-dependent aminotransferase [Halocynthiibacter sp.]
MRNSSRSQVDPFIVMDVMEKARKAEESGRSIIHMEVGQPSTAAPQTARKAVQKLLDEDAMGYTVALGLPELRARIAKLYGDWYNVDLNPERVVVTTGSSSAFLLTFTALFNTGDRVGIGAPGYPSYRQILKAQGLTPVDIQTRAENRLQPVPDDILGRDLSGLMLASPGNPSGTMLSKPALTDLIDAAHGADMNVISDEIYHGLQYETRAVSALEVTDDVYVINSFSKYFSMTGWRIGWMVVPEDQTRVIERLAQNFFICPPHVSQIAAIHAFDGMDELDENLAIYTENRRLMIAGLKEAGFVDFAAPDGAFYIYADVSAFTKDSLAFCEDILEKAGVAVTPGLDFDPVRGATTLRFSYARATEDIKEGLVRLKTYMKEAGHSAKA